MRGAIDRLAMLLSADWFMPHWHSIGIRTPLYQREQFSEQCQDIVRRMMGSQAEYWNISFEDSRIRDTYARFFRLTEQCKFHQHDLEILTKIADESIFDTADSGGGALMLSLTQLFIQDPSFQRAQGGGLSPYLIEKLGVICNSQVTPDFRDCCMASLTQWDGELRVLTPDLPDHLADFAELLFNHIDISRKIWAQISLTFAESDRKILAELYSQTAQDLAGLKLNLLP
jgi:hypothetical protein